MLSSWGQTSCQPTLLFSLRKSCGSENFYEDFILPQGKRFFYSSFELVGDNYFIQHEGRYQRSEKFDTFQLNICEVIHPIRPHNLVGKLPNSDYVMFWSFVMLIKMI